MRLFIGIELPEQIIAELHSLQNLLRKKVRRGRFPSKHNLHLTLQFLGETSENRIEDIIRLLQTVAKVNSPFKLSFNAHLGSFGHKNPVRVVWVGVKGEMEVLLQLQTSIVGRMQELGFPAETRGYHPHVTLARDVDFIDKDFLLDQEEGEFDIGQLSCFNIDHFCLLSSNVEQGKRIYNIVETFKLIDTDTK
ncbi:RNA 2',3'-cyclic phosphodiesterase [Pelosinus sp. UFO1]|uniref:RNA 2',3'-cyclic phosphodiesterase n=1 Tax=Pelosinus sp. UFO1 TaxID=484770 RepID=UPI0004D14AB7|nr:RNA 2',3'-cyclic phosphodiesterase [Pelosinus sp. UFO1]AIF49647.1 2'-5' RNA ligase [Pelosinus sp. UFO1]